MPVYFITTARTYVVQLQVLAARNAERGSREAEGQAGGRRDARTFPASDAAMATRLPSCRDSKSHEIVIDPHITSFVRGARSLLYIYLGLMRSRGFRPRGRPAPPRAS